MTDPVPELATEHTIGGVGVPGDGEPMTIPNPATGRPLGELAAASPAQVDAAVTAARRAFDDGPWPTLDPVERARHIAALADALAVHRDRMVATLVSEVGTPVSLMPMQFDVPLATLRWMARAAALDRTRHLGHELEPIPGASFVAHRPAGVVAAITAYNYPLTLAAWKLGAAMAAGCTTVLMPSPRTPFATTLLGRLAREAGIPDGVVNVVAGAGPDTGRALTVHPGVDKVSFTGSDQVGRQIMAQAAGGLKGVALELGGKSPNIVLPGVDLEPIVAPMHLRYARNAGQGCAVPTRLLLPRDRIDEFVDRSRQIWPRLITGDPWDPATACGPLIRPEHRDRVAAFVDEARADGAPIIAGGGRLDLNGGWYYLPTLIGPVDNGARIAQEEIFGPVAVLIAYDTVDEAVHLANDTRYGLAANVYGADTAECLRVAARLRAGTVTVNGGGGFRPDAPFGGLGHSGVGRELGEWGVHEFLEPQHVQYALAPPPPVTR